MRKRTIPETVRHAFKTCGLSRYELAKRSGIQASTLSRFFTGKSDMGLDTLDKLADLIGIQVVSKRKE